MDYKELIEVLPGVPKNVGEQMILKYLSQDEMVIPSLLQILEMERVAKEELLKDMNLELSRTAVCLEDKQIMKDKGQWILEQVKVFYNKWEHKIRCCFKMEGIR